MERVATRAVPLAERDASMMQGGVRETVRHKSEA